MMSKNPEVNDLLVNMINIVLRIPKLIERLTNEAQESLEFANKRKDLKMINYFSTRIDGLLELTVELKHLGFFDLIKQLEADDE